MHRSGRELGANLIEYALLVALVGMVSLDALGAKSSTQFLSFGNRVSDSPGGNGTGDTGGDGSLLWDPPPEEGIIVR